MSSVFSTFVNYFGMPSTNSLLGHAPTPEFTQPVEQDLYEHKQFESKRSIKKRQGKKKPRSQRKG